MGAFSQGFSYGGHLADADRQRSNQLADEQRQQTLTRNWGILNDPNSDPDIKQQAGQNIQGLYPTPQHGPKLLRDLFHIRDKTQAAQAAAASPAPDTSASPSMPSGPPQMNELGDNMNAKPGGQTNELGAPLPATPPAAPQSGSQPDMQAVGQAKTPKEAMDLWRKYRGPIEINSDIAQSRAEAAAQAAQHLQDMRGKQGIEEAKIRAGGNVSMQELNKQAQSHGFDSFAASTPEAATQILQEVATAKRAPSQAALATYIRAKYGPNASAEQIAEGTRDHQAMMAGIKVGSHQQVVFDDAGIPHVVTLNSSSATQYPGATSPVSTKTPQLLASQPASPQSSSPVSSATPQGPSNPGARSPGTRPNGGAVKSGNGLGFTKGNPLVKSDTAQFTKLAEDDNSKQEALQGAQQAAQSPSPSSDQQLIYSWVKSNVQGAGRMTQAEFNQAARMGSFGQKVDNWVSLASTGKMTPEVRNMILTDIKRSAAVSSNMVQNARGQLQDDSGAKKTPVSASTPKGPSAWKADPAWPKAPATGNKLLRSSNGEVVAKSTNGQWGPP